jgi:hypothetical protein
MSEESKTGLVKTAETRLPKFVEDAYESIEKMEKFADILLRSKLVPHHFYEKLPDGKPDFTKGKTPAVVAVLIQGYQLQLPPLTALQHIIPVNGLLSIKGDLAKSMIFNSGKLKTGSWVEAEEGSIDHEDLIVSITAERSDNGQRLTRSFSVAQAKRAGLWIPISKTTGSDGWKYLASAWWKFPARMINYRALGFIARDLFPDVMAGIYTTEEAADLPSDQTLVIDQGNGVTLAIPDKGFAEERSKKTTGRAVDKIAEKKFEPITEVKSEPVLENIEAFEEASPFKAEKGSVEYMDGIPISRDGNPVTDTQTESGNLSLATMTEMETSDLLNLINENTDMIEALDTIPGKNTNKKIREIIFAYQNGTLADHVVKNSPNESDIKSSDIQPNKDFEKVPDKKEDLIKPESKDLNRYNMNIPAFDKGEERDFKTTKELYQAMINIKPRLDNERYLQLAKDIPEFSRFANKESFCRYATVTEVCKLLDENYLSLQ